MNGANRKSDAEELVDDDHVISRPISPSAQQKGNWTVNSRVLSASLNEGKNRWTNVAAPIQITFVNEKPVAKDAGKRGDAGKTLSIRCLVPFTFGQIMEDGQTN